MPYLIDASSLIEAKERNFCFDICPGFWDWLDQHNTDGNVFSIDRVYDELSRGNDSLVMWAKQRKASFFLPVDPATITAMTQVTQWANGGNFTPRAQEEFLRGADPFLIAYALAHGHTIVTDETYVLGEKKKIKIPAACQKFNVKCMSPLEMLRAEGVRFVLAMP